MSPAWASWQRWRIARVQKCRSAIQGSPQQEQLSGGIDRRDQPTRINGCLSEPSKARSMAQ
jgi:hypothetical protein